MKFFKKLFGITEDKNKTTTEKGEAKQENLNEIEGFAENDRAEGIEHWKSIVLKRASARGYPQETVVSSIRNLSAKELRLLAECADNFFAVYLLSPSGTKAKADAARDIGLR